jgi:hypothetical protein
MGQECLSAAEQAFVVCTMAEWAIKQKKN